MDMETANLLRKNTAQMEALDRLAGKHGQGIKVAVLPPTSILPPDCIAVMWPDNTPLAVIGPTGRMMSLHPNA